MSICGHAEPSSCSWAVPRDGRACAEASLGACRLPLRCTLPGGAPPVLAAQVAGGAERLGCSCAYGGGEVAEDDVIMAAPPAADVA